MRYFLYVDTKTCYAVPKKYWHILDIIHGDDSHLFDDHTVNQAIKTLTQICKPKLIIYALSQTL
jgi:hypothetical protein